MNSVTKMPFRFQREKYHATYKTHVPLASILSLLWKMPPLKMLSVVHEMGDTDEDNPTPYEHTHVFVWHKKPLDTTDSRYWDIDDIHPNIQAKGGINWARTIVTKYHLGHKTKADGKKYYTPPVFLHQAGVEEWKISDDMYQMVIDAPPLEAAAKELDLVPKTSGGVRS